MKSALEHAEVVVLHGTSKESLATVTGNAAEVVTLGVVATHAADLHGLGVTWDAFGQHLDFGLLSGPARALESKTKNNNNNVG